MVAAARAERVSEARRYAAVHCGMRKNFKPAPKHKRRNFARLGDPGRNHKVFHMEMCERNKDVGKFHGVFGQERKDSVSDVFRLTAHKNPRSLYTGNLSAYFQNVLCILRRVPLRSAGDFVVPQMIGYA